MIISRCISRNRRRIRWDQSYRLLDRFYHRFERERIHRIFIKDILIPFRGWNKKETVNLSVISIAHCRVGLWFPKVAWAWSITVDSGWKRTKDETVWGRRKGYTIPFTKVNFCQSWGNRRRYLCVCGYTQCRCWRVKNVSQQIDSA